jgi:acrylyl-CoA reductase (NADPH)
MKYGTSVLPLDKVESMLHSANLGDLAALGKSILEGGFRGRVVVDVNA